MPIDWAARNRAARKYSKLTVLRQDFAEKLCERYRRIVGASCQVSKQEVGYEKMRCNASTCFKDSEFVVTEQSGSMTQSFYYCRACVELAIRYAVSNRKQ